MTATSHGFSDLAGRYLAIGLSARHLGAMRATAVIAVVLLLVIAPALLWMLGPGATWVLENIDQVTSLQDKDRASALAAIRGNILSVATGLAALLAVFYTARNADTARRTFQLGERGHDTDRFSKAVEHLGSSEAPVRLGGLYALEQLAQSNPALRQTTVDVICAYLRMPYTPPREGGRYAKIRMALRSARAPMRRQASGSDGRDPHEEREVRLAAQRLLSDHLRWRSPRKWQRAATANPLFWQNIDLDLSGAMLLNLDLNECRINRADFGGTTFYNGPWFGATTFNGQAWFAGASFTGDSAAVAYFGEAAFNGSAVFQGSSFGDLAQFRNATFARGAWFANTTYKDANFTAVTFDGVAEFGAATFAGLANFNGATFNDEGRFAYVEGENIDLIGARVLHAQGSHAWPGGWQVEPSGAEGGVLQRAKLLRGTEAQKPQGQPRHTINFYRRGAE